MVQLDPHRRIEVIIGQLRHDILAGNACPQFKLRELEKIKRKAYSLLWKCNDIDPKEIENAFSVPKEIEAML